MTERRLITRLALESPCALAVQTGVSVKELLRAYIVANCETAIAWRHPDGKGVERYGEAWERVYGERLERGKR